MSRIGRPPSDIVRRVFGQRIGKADHAVRGEARQNLAGESLGDRTDPEQRVGAGRRVRVVGAVAEAPDRRLPVANDAEDERRDFKRQEQDLAGEAARPGSPARVAAMAERPRRGGR